MRRIGAFRRWTVTALLMGVVGIGAAGCVAVPVGGGYGYGGPEVVVPAPGVVIAPGYYGHRGYYHRGYGRRWDGYRWRG